VQIGRGDDRHPNPWHFTGGTPYLWGSYESLLQYKHPVDPSKGVEVVPALATDWSMDDTGTKWTFTLRQGVK